MQGIRVRKIERFGRRVDAAAIGLPRTDRPRRWLTGFAVLLAATCAARDAAARPSCPLATSVWPLESSALPRYDVAITDGSLGDLDGAADGQCEIALGLCGGQSAACDEGPLDGVRMRAYGGTGPDQREKVTDLVMQAFAAMPADADGSVQSACTTTRLHLAAEEDASVALRFRAIGRDNQDRAMQRRSRLTVACLPAGRQPAAKTKPVCRSGRGKCPGIAEPVCGNGVVDAAGEQCDGADAEACPGACTATCTCADPSGPNPPEPPGVPTCGDGARNQVSETCDGNDDELCPGACHPDCSCGTTSGQSNVAPLATVVASSDTATSTAAAAIDGVVGGLPGDAKYEWTSQEGSGAWLRLTWPTPVTIDRVVLHDRPNDVDNVLDAGLLVGDDGEPVHTGPLPADGAPAAIMLGSRTIASLTFMVMQASGASAGLAEIEAVGAVAPPPPPPPPPSTGPTYYLSPSGNDAASGKTAGESWKTFARAVKALQPGDTLVVADGTYTRTTTGLPSIRCGSNAQNGTQDKPITIKAQNERKAFLSSDGLQTGFEMDGCSWWNVEGLRAANKDNSSGDQLDGYAFRFTELNHVNLRRLLGSHNNRMQNTHVYAVENSQNVLLEECEAYYYHRHAFSIWRSRFITMRRCYANSMQYGTQGCCSTIDNRSYGDEAYSLYGTSDSIVENSISENQANGFQIHGISSPLDPSGHGGRRNRILGSISLNDTVSALVSSRATGGDYHNARDNVFRNFVAANTGGNGIYLRGAAGTLLENVTLYHSTGNSGLRADNGDSGVGGTCGSGNPDGCSFTARNLLALSNRVYGVDYAGSYKSWMVEYSDAAGNGSSDYSSSESPSDAGGSIQNSQRTAAPNVGMGSGQCVLWAPAGSWLHGSGKNGADIGATIVDRYQDGNLTGTPLWDPTTGAFPCGAVVAGLNDGATACRNVHVRLNANVNGCPMP